MGNALKKDVFVNKIGEVQHAMFTKRKTVEEP